VQIPGTCPAKPQPSRCRQNPIVRLPRNPKNGASAKDRNSEKWSSTSRYSSCQRSSVSPGHQYSHPQFLEFSIKAPSPAPSSQQVSR
jgi:hypothetical protein